MELTIIIEIVSLMLFNLLLVFHMIRDTAIRILIMIAPKSTQKI